MHAAAKLTNGKNKVIGMKEKKKKRN